MSTTAVRLPATYAVSLSLAALAMSACGGAARLEPDEAFRRIQVHEATIAHRSAEASRCEPGEPCPAADEVCEAADRLCVIAERLQDADALARCELARRQCSETIPGEATPAEATPAETTPAETTPTETSPAETTPAETTPAEAAE